MVHIGNDWDLLLKDEFSKQYYLDLRKFLLIEYKTRAIYPSKYDIFNALRATSYENTKVLLLGQDPYHGKGQAHGMCFSVPDGVQIPPSLVNIFKELSEDLAIPVPKSGNLSRWAQQGMLLLNTALTVRENQANSHKGVGWEILTDKIIELLSEKKQPVVFLLWGGNARRKAELIKNANHLVLQTAHPSPLSAYMGFIGCKHFSATNQFLRQNGMQPVDWNLS